MARVRIFERRIWVDDEPRALLSGEVHYWRIDPGYWPEVLARTRELGLDVLSSYICWDFHELERGRFDFTGSTNARRDLLGFLDMAAASGFWVLARPGPYIYAEWPNSGIPERVVPWHRLHPKFQAEASEWIRAVSQALRPYLATNGGPVVLIQADNEADPWVDVYARDLGLADCPGMFQHFLRARYIQIGELNTAWGTEYTTFDEVRAVIAPAPEEFRRRYLDFCRFRHWYGAEVVRWTTAALRGNGIDVPIYTNAYIHTAVQDWRALETACDLAGPDIYPSSALANDFDEHRGVMDAVRYACTYSKLPFVPEFESGIWHGWHADVGTLEATHYLLNGLVALQAGIRGWNWYMLVNRDSWYMSPITELGRSRPDLAPAFEELVRLFRTIDPPALTKLTQTAVTFSALEHGAGLGGAGQDVNRALYMADIDYELFDLATGQIARPMLVYAGGGLLEADERSRLDEYVRSGGILVVFQPGPGFLGLAAPGAVTTAGVPDRIRLELGDGAAVLSSRAVFVYDESAGEPIWAERIEPLPPTQEGGHAHVRLAIGERLRIGFVEPRGQGRVVALGVSPTPELMLCLHRWLGVHVPSRALVSSGRVHTALFQRGDGAWFLIVTNTGAEPRDALIHLDVDAIFTEARDLRSGAAVDVVRDRVIATIPAASGTVLRLN